MSRMLPPSYDPDISPGEREVFERLRDDPDTDNWTVLHSYGIADHPRQIQGEADFVILVPGAGIVCLEVKAHRSVSRLPDGRWKLGTQPPKIHGPFTQADETKYAIVKLLQSAKPRLPDIPITSAVCFTHARFQVSNPTEWHTWQAIDTVAFHRRPISALVRHVINSHRKHLAETPTARSWFDKDSSEPAEETLRKVVDELRPKFEFVESPKIRRQRRNDETEHFTQEQFALLDMIADNPRCIVSGAAGTGKTFIALEAARRYAAAGERVLFCCYNTLLAKWLEEETENESRITARTLHSYMRKLAGAQAAPGPAGQDRFFKKELPDLALSVLLDESDEFDVVIVDEAQDLMLDSYLDVLDASLRRGLGSGRWLFFGDLTNQAIYDSGCDGIEVLQERIGTPARFTLARNCRNVPAISQYVEETSRLEPGYSSVLRSDNGRETAREWWTTRLDQKQLLVKHLQRLRQDFDPDEIVILSPRGPGSAAEQCSDPRWSRVLAPFKEADKKSIRYGTIHSFKGLDAPAVVVTDIEELKDANAESLFYIASSRARDDLTVIARDTARADFRRLILGE
ncbi:NERD domain-containing protein/DEAD/DEAH box helicase [Saccharopolyspora shandongensis]|uniref:nuclease-related domain-containing DEAD/DEAH box helicase n=1 Tax=Saccharopolyspora shandongensis TaxID=418495 RepID=UPI00341005F5